MAGKKGSSGNGRSSSGGSGRRGRSASTGRFVKQATVKRHPNTTVNESTKKSK
jgi:hypothetical protein